MNSSMAPELDPTMDFEVDLLIVGGRVIDPRSSLDSVVNVAISDGKIVSIGPQEPQAKRTIDALGLVVCPGFIDIHSHAQSPLGLGLQALDGVTTALDLEAGTLPIALQYENAEAEGRPINFGFSASWAVARLKVMAGVPLPARDPLTGELVSALDVFLRNQLLPDWHALAAPNQVDRMLGILADALGEGAIGIGVLLGYSPDSGREEYFRVAQLAEAAGVPVFTHSRQMSNLEPLSSVDGALEILGVAAGSGAHMHICHINSTSLRRIDDVAAAVSTAQTRGNRVTTEAYPYAIASTGIGARFLDPGRLDRIGIQPSGITYLPTGRRVENEAELAHLRASDPGGLCLIDYLDDTSPGDISILLESFQLAGTVVASDAMPLVDVNGSYLKGGWPVPPDARVHPRSLGTFCRTFGWLVRETDTLTLHEAILRTSTMPAELLAPFVPAMANKGRLARGFDADLTLFDPLTISDRATASAVIPSHGVRYLIVNGLLVIDDSVLDQSSSAGMPIRSK